MHSCFSCPLCARTTWGRASLQANEALQAYKSQDEARMKAVEELREKIDATVRAALGRGGEWGWSEACCPSQGLWPSLRGGPLRFYNGDAGGEGRHLIAAPARGLPAAATAPPTHPSATQHTRLRR